MFTLHMYRYYTHWIGAIVPYITSSYVKLSFSYNTEMPCIRIMCKKDFDERKLPNFRNKFNKAFAFVGDDMKS